MPSGRPWDRRPVRRRRPRLRRDPARRWRKSRDGRWRRGRPLFDSLGRRANSVYRDASASSRSRAMRSSVEGCVENSRIMLSPLKGLMMNRCAVAGFTSVHGDALGPAFQLRRAPRSARSGLCVYLAEVSSAAYSRVREIAIWISMAAMGARISMIKPAQALPRLSSSSRLPPNQNAMRARKVMAAAMVAATELVRMSRFLTCPSSCATTPSSSESFISRRMPAVNATEACSGFRPVAKALGDSLGNQPQLGHGQAHALGQALHQGKHARVHFGILRGVTGCAEYIASAILSEK